MVAADYLQHEKDKPVWSVQSRRAARRLTVDTAEFVVSRRGRARQH